jgi:hypothetical protein
VGLGLGQKRKGYGSILKRVLLTNALRAMFKEAFNASALWEVVKI